MYEIYNLYQEILYHINVKYDLFKNFRYETNRQRSSGGTGGGLSSLCPKLVSSGSSSSQSGISLAVGHLASQETGGTCTVVTTQKIHAHNHRRQRKLSIVTQAGTSANITGDRKVSWIILVS